jgi:uncharacterized protein (DUF58 family)
MQLIDPYKVWVMIGVTFGLLWLAGYVWARSLARGLSLKREMRFGWAQVGDSLEERWTLHHDGGLPAIWVEVHDHSTLPGYPSSRATGVDAHGVNSWRTRGLCTRRGIFTLGPTTLRSGDPLGIYSVEIDLPSFTTLTVMPPVVPLPAIQIAPGGRAGEGSPRRDAPERTVSSASVRQYAPGDSLRWVHWRTTARRDEPFVRIFDGTPAGDWWIFLDLHQGSQAGEGWDSTEEHAVILAASIAQKGMEMQRAVGLVSNAEELIWLPPDAGESPARRWEILRALAVAKPGSSSLAELFLRVKPSIPARSSLVIITPDTGSTWIEAVMPLMWRGVAPTVLLLDPQSFGGDRSVRPAADILQSMGITTWVITPDLLNREEARPGHEGEWEWRMMPTGKAVAVRQPTNQSWKALS